MSLEKYKRLTSLMLALLIVTTISLSFILLGCDEQRVTSENKSPDIVNPTEEAARTPSMEIDRQEELEMSYEKYKDIKSAANEVPFEPRMPKKSLGKKLVGIYVDTIAPLTQRELTILYSDGLDINASTLPCPSYEAICKTFRDNNEKADTPPQPLPEKVKIAGFDGYGNDNGFNTTMNGEKVPRPGYVVWSDNDVTYSMYGDGLNIDQLLEVAESMY